jgi:pSer/pThr/pTyr-binding forkhead associated (FHA) protein
MGSEDFKLKHQDSGELIPLADRNTLGRSSDNDIKIEGDQVSRKHAVIELVDGALTITDLGSSNGTYVNEQAIAASTLLFNGDVIRFDKVHYAVDSPVERPIADAEEEASTDDAATMITPVEDDVTRISAAEVAAPAPEPAASPPTPAASPDPAPAADIPPLWADKDGLESASHTQVVFDAVTSDDVNDYMRGNIPVPALGETPRLVGLSPAIRGKIYDLQPTGETRTWEIGRADNLDIVVLDPSETVSGQHAQLVNEGQRWKIVNWMSTNGTFVNGRKGLSTYLKSGDIIRLGSIEFAFEMKAVQAQSAPVVEATKPAGGGVGKWMAIGLGAVIALVIITLILI